MNVHVTYLAQLRRLTGKAEETVAVADGCTLSGLLALLAERHGETVRKVLCRADDRPQPSLLIFRGEEQAEAADVQLADGEKITLLTPMAGG